MRRGARVLGRRRRRLLREVGREALVEEERPARRCAAQLLGELPRSRAPARRARRAASAACPTIDLLRRLVVRRARTSSASPASVRTRSTTQSGRAIIAGRVGDGDARARRAEVERHHLHASAATACFARLERVARRRPGSCRRPPRASACRRPPPPMCLPSSRTSCRRVETALHERLVEVDDEERAAVVDSTRRSRRPPSPAGAAGRRDRAAARPSAPSPRRGRRRPRARRPRSRPPRPRGGFFASLRTRSSSARSSSASRACSCRYANASPAVTASMRRAPEPTELSVRIANGPISAVERTCVPPQSSTDQPPMSTTRTTSPYFSPKSIIAPSLRASSIGVSKMRTGRFAKMLLVHAPLDLGALLGAERLRMREVEAQLVGAHRRAGLLARGRRAPRAGTRAARASPCGSPSSGSARSTATTARTRSPAAKPVALEEQHLVLLEAVRLAQRRARAVVLLDEAGVGDLAAARRIERRLARASRGTGRRRARSSAPICVSTSVFS